MALDARDRFLIGTDRARKWTVGGDLNQRYHLSGNFARTSPGKIAKRIAVVRILGYNGSMPVIDTKRTKDGSRTETGHLETECRVVVGEVQGALLEAYGVLGLDPAQPQEASRRLGLNKNLTWKISKILTE